MPNSYEIFRSRLAREMRDVHKEKNKQLEEVENSSLHEKMKEQKRKEIINNFENYISEIKNRHGYEEARKKHLDEIRKKMRTGKGQPNIYRNDGDANYEKIPKEDARIAAEVYGEGYKPLVDFLRVCFENDIQTFGCCSGHPDIDDLISYVYLDGSNEKVKKLIEFIIENNLADQLFIAIYDEDGKKYTNVSVTLDVIKRYAFYRHCTKKLKQIIKEENSENNSEKNSEENYIIDKLITSFKKYGIAATFHIQENKLEIHTESDPFIINDIIQG